MAKEFELTLIRGDSYRLTFSLFNKKGEPIVLADNDMCYFTVKEKLTHEEYIFQKKYGDGITYNSQTGLYEIRLSPEDTCDLDFASYKFDIKVKIGEEIVKTILRGVLILMINVTHRCNE